MTELKLLKSFLKLTNITFKEIAEGSCVLVDCTALEVKFYFSVYSEKLFSYYNYKGELK